MGNLKNEAPCEKSILRLFFILKNAVQRVVLLHGFPLLFGEVMSCCNPIYVFCYKKLLYEQLL
jgi:hypothetical protein